MQDKIFTPFPLGKLSTIKMRLDDVVNEQSSVSMDDLLQYYQFNADKGDALSQVN